MYNIRMTYLSEDEEIECDIVESFGAFSGVSKSWLKEVNLIKWNGRIAKLDIRSWQKDHKKCGKGIAITWEEAKGLAKLLNKILKERDRQERAKKEKERREKERMESIAKKMPDQFKALEPCYDELELVFGAGPDECKSARNNLLKKYHPDKNIGNVSFATRKTIKIKEAYDKIMAWWNKL